MPIGKPDFSYGRMVDPVGDFSKSLGSFTDRLLQQQRQKEVDARYQQELEYQRERDQKADERAANAFKIQQSQENRAAEKYLTEKNQAQALVDIAKSYTANPTSAKFGADKADDKMDTFLLNDVVAKRQAEFDPVLDAMKHNAPLTEDQTSTYNKYKDGLLSPTESEAIQAQYETIQPYREDVQQGIFNAAVAGNADPVKAATLSQTLTANLPSKAEEEAKIAAAVKRRDDLSKDFLKEYNKVNVAKIKANAKTYKPVDVGAVVGSIDKEEAGWIDSSDFKDKVKIAIDRNPGVSTLDVKNAIQMAVDDGIVDKTFNQDVFDKYLSKAASTHMNGTGYTGSTNLINKYKTLQSEIGADYVPSTANPDANLAKLKNALGYSATAAAPVGAIANKVVEKATKTPAKEAPVTKPIVSKPTTTVVKPSTIENIKVQANNELDKVNTYLAQKSKDGLLTPLEVTQRKLGLHPDQLGVERQRDIKIAREERKQDTIARRAKMDEDNKIKKMSNNPTIVKEYYTALDKARRQKGYIGTSAAPTGYTSIEDYIRTFKLKGK